MNTLRDTLERLIDARADGLLAAKNLVNAIGDRNERDKFTRSLVSSSRQLSWRLKEILDSGRIPLIWSCLEKILPKLEKRYGKKIIRRVVVDIASAIYMKQRLLESAPSRRDEEITRKCQYLAHQLMLDWNAVYSPTTQGDHINIFFPSRDFHIWGNYTLLVPRFIVVREDSADGYFLSSLQGRHPLKVAYYDAYQSAYQFLSNSNASGDEWCRNPEHTHSKREDHPLSCYEIWGGRTKRFACVKGIILAPVWKIAILAKFQYTSYRTTIIYSGTVRRFSARPKEIYVIRDGISLGKISGERLTKRIIEKIRGNNLKAWLEEDLLPILPQSAAQAIREEMSKLDALYYRI